MAEEKPRAFKKGRGRPSKLTEEVEKNILQMVKAGNYLETAAAYAGVSKEVLFKWLRLGREQKKGRLHDFVQLVEKALAEAEVRDVVTIGAAAQQYWQAAAWRLERKFPNRWGSRSTIQHTGNNGEAIQVETRTTLVDKMANDEETRKLVLSLAEKLDTHEETKE